MLPQCSFPALPALLLSLVRTDSSHYALLPTPILLRLLELPASLSVDFHGSWPSSQSVNVPTTAACICCPIPCHQPSANPPPQVLQTPKNKARRAVLLPMPPVRTVPAKAVRSERTHEENQERAYIAASRRSDRTIEARVESARRASEIHKRRTGRSLRVTEQDVINEEMYEEEDDNLPYPYRRMAASLQTGSPDYNRRLAAFLRDQAAMRSALDQAVTISYDQAYPNAPQLVQNQSMYQSPFAIQQTQQMLYNPPPYHPALAAPYPVSQHSPISSVDLPQRPATIPLRGVGTSSPLEPCHSRSMSLAVHPLASPPPTPTATVNAHATQPRSTQQIPANLPSNYNHQMMLQQQHQFMRSTSGMQSTASMQSTMSMRPALGMQSTPGPNPPRGDRASPYTMSLPPKQLMPLGNLSDANDPLTSTMAGGNETPPPYYNYDPYVPGAYPSASSYDSLPETSAPNAPDLVPLDSYTTSTLDQPYTQVPIGVYGVSSTNDGSTTVADGEWGAFIDNDWEQGNELSDSLSIHKASKGKKR